MAEQNPLPPKYYLTYFDYLIDFVQNMYGELLTPSETDFIRCYRSLPEDARCLFVRMSNRKGPYFKPETFVYPEIDDIEGSLERLIQLGFARYLEIETTEYPETLLNLLTKGELVQLTRSLEPIIMPSSQIKKNDLVRWLLHENEMHVLLHAILSNHRFVEVLFSQEVELMKFLFFGNRYDDMTEFVIRDLGHVRYQSFDDEALSQKFKTRKEMEDALAVSYLKENFLELITTRPAEDVYEWFELNRSDLSIDLSEMAKPSLDRLTLRVAQWLERQKMFDQALELYDLTTAPPARERKTRLLYKIGHLEEAKSLCQEMASFPQNADELYFGQDFYERISSKKYRTVRQTTQALQEADVIYLPSDFRYQVEFGAVDYYLQQGFDAFFSENVPWRSIFGLLFWDIIYDTNVQAIHHPLQRVPSDFFLPDFYVKREAQLQARMAQLDSTKKIHRTLTNTFEQKYGIANVLVGWHEALLQQVLTINTLLSVDQLHQILLEMATDLRDKARGFPDLLVWRGKEYSFVEIKSPTDHLSARQLYWQHYFREKGVSSKIVRVKWNEGNKTSST